MPDVTLGPFSGSEFAYWHLFSGLALIWFMMVSLWAKSILLRNASIVDIFWGLGFVLLAWYYHALAGAVNPWAPLLVTIWGLRLASHIYWRNRGQPEDRRYAAMRAGRESYFAWWSLGAVFLFQGALLWVIAVPLYFFQKPWFWNLGTSAGLALWCVGFFFEAVGDWQLAKFKRDPANRGKVLSSGLWKYTRHPNYFGDSAQWFGYCLLALGLGGPWWLVYSPVLMTYFLLKVSGVSLLEKDISGRRPEYQDYVRRTSSFLPWFPKK